MKISFSSHKYKPINRNILSFFFFDKHATAMPVHEICAESVRYVRIVAAHFVKLTPGVVKKR